MPFSGKERIKGTGKHQQSNILAAGKEEFLQKTESSSARAIYTMDVDTDTVDCFRTSTLCTFFPLFMAALLPDDLSGATPVCG